VEAFNAAVRLRPNDVEAHIRLAVAQLKLGNAAAAREQLEALKSLDPEAAKQLQQAIEQGGGKLP
jgi:cytochrome c-type biogenesis protein CcmH/NrfG